MRGEAVLKQRIVTALVIAVVFLGLLFLGTPAVFALFSALVIAVGAWEWSGLSGLARVRTRVLYSLTVSAILFGLYRVCGFGEGPIRVDIGRQVLLAGASWWAVALLWVQGYPSSALLWGSTVVRLIMGLFVLVPAWLALALLAHVPGGVWLILLVVLVVACADVGAYFCGHAFGRRKLAATVSPGKTLEGFAGGLVTVLVVCAAFLYFVPSQWSLWWQWSLIVLATALVSVLGDLTESMLKRHHGVKDSGVVLPGHGGVLDRIDSLTAALPVFALLYSLLILPAHV